MRKRAFAILIASVVVLASSVLIFLESTGSQSQGSQYLKQCPVSWPPEYPGPNTTQLETLVAMTIQPGSTGEICVEYNSVGSSPATTILNGTAYYEGNMSEVPASSISLTAVPQPLTAPGIGGKSPVPVAYALFTLHVSPSAQGFFMLSLPGLCPLMPMAIGQSEINYTDFAYGWHHQNQCQRSPLVGSYVAVDNIGVMYSYIPLQDQ